MNSSAPRVDSLISSPDSSQEQYAGQPEQAFSKRLVRGFYRSVAAACTIPPLVFAASLVPLNAQGAIIVTTWTALMLTYVLSTTARMRSDLRTGERKWNELRGNAIDLERAYDGLSVVYEKLQDRYDYLYAQYILERGAVPLVAKKSSRGAAADSSGALNGSAAVLEFPKGA